MKLILFSIENLSMKKVFLLSVMFFQTFFAVKAQESNHYTKYDSLILHRDFFKLRELIKLEKDKENPNYLYYKSLADNYFNKPKESIKKINKLLKKFPNQVSDIQKSKLLITNLNNYLRVFEYQSAYKIAEKLTSYKKYLTPIQIEDLDNNTKILKGLLNANKQKINLKNDVKFNYFKDVAGLINVPVLMNQKQDSFVFDTGANLSVVTEETAKKYNLELSNFYFDVKAITGIVVKARTGVAKNIRIGEIDFENIVFLVIPNNSLTFAEGKYIINGIIGFPVIEQLGEVHITNKNTMYVPKTPKDIELENLGLDELTPIIQLETFNSKVAYTFDTGAGHTILNNPFFKKFEDQINDDISKEQLYYGGAGGNESSEGYKLKSWTSTINNKPVSLENVDLKIKSTLEHDQHYFGNIGQDVISQFSEMIINFKYMYIDFSN